VSTGSDRYLHLTRHGEADADEAPLTERGRHQAALLGTRLRDSGVPCTAVHHGPCPGPPRAAVTTERLGGVPAHPCDPAAD
jgi:probable phosphoglycerate mutase